MNVVAVVMAVSCLDCYRYSNPNHVGGEIQVLDGVLVVAVAVAVVVVVVSVVGDGFHLRWVWYREMMKCPCLADYLE